MAPKSRDSGIAEAVPLRPATPIDTEIARPHPEDFSLTEGAEAEMKRHLEDPAEPIAADDRSEVSEEAADPDEETARRERATRANLESMR